MKKSNFFIQGSILAIAGIICRLIGFVYRVPMTAMLGQDGLAYYSRAYNVYNIALIVSSYGMPLAISKLVAAKIALKEYKNEQRILRCALTFSLMTGLITSMVVFFGADFFAIRLFNMPECSLPLKVLAPTIFVCSIMGTLRGYFQGNGNMIPTSVSQIVEQIINAVVSIFATKVFIDMYKQKSYGAAGGTLGTTLGALFSLLFLIIVFFLTNKSRKSRIKSDIYIKTESYRSIYILIISTIISIILSQTVYNLNSIVDSSVFCHMNRSDNNDTLLGAYDIYLLLVSIPVAIATALSNALVPSVVAMKVKRKSDKMMEKISSAIRINMIIAIPAAVGLMVLSKNIISMMFSRNISVELSGRLLSVGSLAVVFYALSTTSSAVLQATDFMKIPIINSSISLVIHLIFVVIFLKCNLGIYSIAIGNVIFAFGVCILNWITLKRKIGYKQEIVRTFVLPCIASVIVGIVIYVCSNVLVICTNSNTIATLVSIMVAIMIYGVLIVKYGAISKNEILNFPKGEFIYRLFRKMHLVK